MKINIKNIKIKSICATLFISLFLSCNNGIEELEKKNQFLSSLANLGNDFLSVFTSFGDSFGGVLAFDKTTTKSKVGEYFKKIQETVQGVKTGLNKIVTDMKNQNNPNAEATGTAVTTLNLQLSKIIEGAKTVSDAIGDTDNGLIVDFGGGGDGVGVAGDSKVVQSITEGIKTISDIVLKGKGKADSGDNKNPAVDTSGADGSARNVDADDNTNNGAIALFAKKAIGTTAGVGKAAKDAAKAVGAVTGADILQAMAQVGGNSAKLAINDKTLSDGQPISAGDAKDATIAGGIVLRSIAKGGKFSNKSGGSDGGAKQQIQYAAISAVTKALNTLTIEIRKTLDTGLKTVKDAMNISANDTHVTTESGIIAK